MLISTFGPVPSHCTLYSPGASFVPFTLMGSCTCRDPLFAANALVASSTASPRTRLFVTFIDSFSLPNHRRESVLGGPAASSHRNPCVSPKLAYNAAVGVQDKRARPQNLVLLLRGLSSSGRQTELRQSPEPRKLYLSWKRQRSSRLIPKNCSLIRSTLAESSISFSVSDHSLDDAGCPKLALDFLDVTY